MNGDAARAAWAESLEPVTVAMLESVCPGPGDRVLDVGAGTGDLSFRIAGCVGPTGRVVAVDPAPGAIEALTRHRPKDGESAVQAVRSAAETLDLDDPVDIIVARNAVMYFTDLDRALGNLHRLLRSGGRLAVSVYARLEHEPYHAIPLAAVRRHGPLGPPLPEYAAAFAVTATDVVAALGRAGFRSVRAREVGVQRSFPSFAALEAALRASGSLRELLERLGPAERTAAWPNMLDAFGRHVVDDGRVVVPGRQVVISATA